MTEGITPLIAGNWKMNGTAASLAEVGRLTQLLLATPPRCTVLLCPPATLLSRLAAAAASGGILCGGQDCAPQASGAFTGDVSAPMLVDAGAQFVILGHSERRHGHGESDSVVRTKTAAAIASELTPIVCIGETAAERQAGEAEAVVARQLGGSLPDGIEEFVIAYEPVWAIGTGVTPTNNDIAAMHAHIRGLLLQRFGDAARKTHILYGGSVKPANAREILGLDNVDGALVGGASLLANDFHAIISAV